MMGDLKGKYSFLEAKMKLEALCAYQERCSWELDQKMIGWGVDSEDRGRLLAHLIEHNFLNEERFAQAFVSGKINIKRWGRVKIRQQLKQKKISDYSIQKAFSEIDESQYLSNLQQLAEKKWRTLGKEKDTYVSKMKVARFLSSKGYESDLIRESLENL